VWFEDFDLHNLYIEVLESMTTKRTASQLGEVIGGNLKLSCEALLPCRRVEHRTFELESGQRIQGLIFMDTENQMFEKDVCYHLLPIAKQTIIDHPSNTSRDEIEALVLQLTCEERGQYQRVGQFSTGYGPSSPETGAKMIVEAMTLLHSGEGLGTLNMLIELLMSLGTLDMS